MFTVISVFLSCRRLGSITGSPIKKRIKQISKPLIVFPESLFCNIRALFLSHWHFSFLSSRGSLQLNCNVIFLSRQYVLSPPVLLIYNMHFCINKQKKAPRDSSPGAFLTAEFLPSFLVLSAFFLRRITDIINNAPAPSNAPIAT